jgi:hypothetical protein
MSNLRKIYSKPGVVRRRLDPDEWAAVTALVKARELVIDAEVSIRSRVNELEDENPTCERCGQDSKETKAATICTRKVNLAHSAINAALDAYGAKSVAPWDLEGWPEKTASQDALCEEISGQDELPYPPKLEEV